MTETFTGLELRSLVTSGGTLQLELAEVVLDAPGPDEVVVRIEAAPLNPSDLGLLLGPADLSTMQAGGTADRPTLTATIPPKALVNLGGRLDQSLPVGNEGAGTVVAAGANVADMIGKTVGVFGGGMYTQFRKLRADDCMLIPDGATVSDGASMFVNPLTALAFVETMRNEGHTAIVHTAAASNLGQMLNKICLADGVPLVNIVRSEEQAAILRAIGAAHIIDSAAPDFEAQLADAVAATGATLAFDAIGGGRLAGQILAAMEKAANRNAGSYSRYGSTTHKQVYLYGGLDVGPTIVDRTFGMALGMGGWLVFDALQTIGGDVLSRSRGRVARELTTTFASRYTATISLREALKPEIVTAYQRKTTGEKYLIDPSA